MMPAARRALATAVLLATLPAAIEAQDRPEPAAGPRIGERLQIRARIAERRGWRVDCEGRLAEVAGDTLVLTPTTTVRWCPRQLYPADAVERVRVVRGDRGSRAAHAGIGALIGAAVGGLSMYSAVRSSCSGSCSGGDNSGILTLLAIIGGVGGGSLGALVGFVVPAGPRWVTALGPTPVRVIPER